jgi:hypothetical protein
MIVHGTDTSTVQVLHVQSPTASGSASSADCQGFVDDARVPQPFMFGLARADARLEPGLAVPERGMSPRRRVRQVGWQSQPRHGFRQSGRAASGPDGPHLLPRGIRLRPVGVGEQVHRQLVLGDRDLVTFL